jgi:hypothetical protein
MNINIIKKALKILFATIIAFPVYAQSTDVSTKDASTKIEAFSSRTGIVMIKGYQEVGSVGETGMVSIDAREYRNASNPKQAEYGVVFEVKESGRLERENSSFVDADEIDALIQGIDYISGITKSITPLSNFEAEYRTKGDFSIVVFSQSNGELGVAVASGRAVKTNAYLKISDLARLKELIRDAKKLIDKLKSK